MTSAPDDELQRLATRVLAALAGLGCRGHAWVVYDAIRVTVEDDSGVLGWLAVHRDGSVTADGMRARGAEVLAHVRRELERAGGGS